MPKKKIFKFKRTCKLPSCSRPFKTNRKWQEFHHPDCQRKWQIVLRQSNAEIIQSLELLKADMKNIKEKTGPITKRDMEWVAGQRLKIK